MKQFFQDVLTLGYKSNSQGNPLHEQQVEDLLIKHNIKYQAQPNGIQNSPDFRVLTTVVDIECKSSKQTFPTYNGGLPKKGVVYIFSSAKYDETTIFFADDVVSDKKRELLERTQLKMYQMEEEWQEDSRGFDFYIRNMYTQSGAGKRLFQTFRWSKKFSITTGNCQEVLSTYGENFFHTDPPYGMNIVGEEWIAVDIWRDFAPWCVCVIFLLSELYHRMAVNVEDAGFKGPDYVDDYHKDAQIQ